MFGVTIEDLEKEVEKEGLIHIDIDDILPHFQRTNLSFGEVSNFHNDKEDRLAHCFKKTMSKLPFECPTATAIYVCATGDLKSTFNEFDLMCHEIFSRFDNETSIITSFALDQAMDGEVQTSIFFLGVEDDDPTVSEYLVNHELNCYDDELLRYIKSRRLNALF